MCLLLLCVLLFAVPFATSKDQSYDTISTNLTKTNATGPYPNIKSISQCNLSIPAAQLQTVWLNVTLNVAANQSAISLPTNVSFMVQLQGKNGDLYYNSLIDFIVTNGSISLVAPGSPPFFFLACNNESELTWTYSYRNPDDVSGTLIFTSYQSCSDATPHIDEMNFDVNTTSWGIFAWNWSPFGQFSRTENEKNGVRTQQPSEYQIQIIRTSGSQSISDVFTSIRIVPPGLCPTTANSSNALLFRKFAANTFLVRYTFTLSTNDILTVFLERNDPTQTSDFSISLSKIEPPPPSTEIPFWVWVLVGLGGVILVIVIIVALLKRNRKPTYEPVS